jgi:uncharacterized membrane protein YraQ (UPF0718 family)
MLGKQSDCESTHFEYAIWNHPERIARFNNELWAMTKLIVICLGLAFAAEYQMQAHIQPEAFVEYVGKDSKWAIPLAVLVGSPAYLDSYAALPLTRGSIDHGMSQVQRWRFWYPVVLLVFGALSLFSPHLDSDLLCFT